MLVLLAKNTKWHDYWIAHKNIEIVRRKPVTSVHFVTIFQKQPKKVVLAGILPETFLAQ